MLRLIFMFIFMSQSSAVIYKLNESEYNRMPPLYALEDFHSCMSQPAAQYCLVDVELFSDAPSDLMTLIQEYSEHKLKHYNHTEIHRGVCVTQTCQHFKRKKTNTTWDLNVTLEACLNASLWKYYQLQGRLVDINHCITEGKKTKIDVGDVAMAVIYLMVLLLNAIGSFYDIYVCRKKSGNPYLLAFSIRRNWARLTASTEGSDPRMAKLKVLDGMRVIMILCVVFVHTVFVASFSYIENPDYVEKSYDEHLMQLLYSALVMTSTFFVLAGFILVYNFLIRKEKQAISWWQLPKDFLRRWLRLTPTYAFVFGTVVTWMRHTGKGPLWHRVVVSEAFVCRQYWWAHLFYFNNYVYDDAICEPHTWQLAAQMQLDFVGLLFCYLARTRRAQKLTAIALFLLGMVIVAAHTYFQDLDAVVVQSPEVFSKSLPFDDTFRIAYVRGHCNLSAYTLGLALGFLVYYWQKDGVDFIKYKKLRWLYWLTFPCIVGVILSGGWFYKDGARAPLYARVVYAILCKPVFSILVGLVIVGSIFRFEDVYRAVLEWRGWTWMGRVCYSVYLLHMIFQRTYFGSQTQPFQMSDYNVAIVVMGIAMVSFIVGAALWLLVEAPSVQLSRALLDPKRRHLESKMAAAGPDNAIKL